MSSLPLHSVIAVIIVAAVAGSFSLYRWVRARRECRRTMAHCRGFGHPAAPLMSDRDRAVRNALAVR